MEDAKFLFSNNTFYEDAYPSFSTITEGGSYGTFSPTYQLSQEATPLHNWMTISIRPINLPENLRDKAFIAYCPRGSSKTFNCGGKWGEDGFLTSKNSSFGNYSILTDVIPPSIRLLKFQYDMRKFGKMSFKINDNYDTAGNGDGLMYRATVDGSWILMEFDSKSDVLFHQFDGRIGNGEHILNLKVSDNRGNEAVYESKFKL